MKNEIAAKLNSLDRSTLTPEWAEAVSTMERALTNQANALYAAEVVFVRAVDLLDGKQPEQARKELAAAHAGIAEYLEGKPGHYDEPRTH